MDIMAEDFKKLQVKYDKWRSRSIACKKRKRSFHTFNGLSNELTKSVQTSPIRLDNVVLSELSTKSSEISHCRENLNSIELAFRLEVQKFERQLNELIELKALQDKERQPPKPATRNIKVQWSPPSQSIITRETSCQIDIKPRTLSTSTLTASKYLKPPESSNIDLDLEEVIHQKNSRIVELEEAYSVAMEMMETLRSELVENKTLLAEKCAELSQEKLRMRPRRQRGFCSKASQSESIRLCDREIDAKPIQTLDACFQTEDYNTPTEIVPGFLTEALMGLDKSQGPNSSTVWNDHNLVDYFVDTTGHEIIDPRPNTTDEPLANTQNKVNVSVNIADASNEEGTNLQALMGELKSAEDIWANQLDDNTPRSSPTWLSTEQKDQLKQISDDTVSAPAICDDMSVPVTSAAAILLKSAEACSPVPWHSDEKHTTEENHEQEIEIQLPEVYSALDHAYNNSFGTQNFIKDVPSATLGVPQSSAFTYTSANAAGDTCNEENGSRSPKEGERTRGDSFYGLALWDDDDVEQLAVQFLANEREHSAQLEAVIERHLEQLRLEVAS
nr:Centrosomal protein of 63 kDa (Cep63 protein) [Hymenolepis microstoma]